MQYNFLQNKFKISPGFLAIDDVQHLLATNTKIILDEACWKKVTSAREFIDNIINTNQIVYGVNTGFGLLATTIINRNELTKLQRNLLLSHAAGTGELLINDIVKLILLLKINSLARGYSGVRPIILEALVKFYNHGIYPCVPAKGSVGASGDLAPLAHLSLPLIGEGQASYQGNIISGKEALSILALEPIELAAKEGLALINGTQASTAIALYNLLNAQRLLCSATIIGALTVDAAASSDTPFEPKIHEVRGQRGQIIIAKFLHDMLAGSSLRESHRHCNRVQDPYSLRCQPQILGACLDNLQHATNILMTEANAVSDNPLIFAELGQIISGGNFHAEPVAQVADLIAIALAEISALAERRIALLMDPRFNGGLPVFLVRNSGINSGFMIGHVTAAALASANKSLAHPASVDSLPTSANQEDHVSMATYAAYRLGEIVNNVLDILAIELLAACQGIDLRQPLKTSPILETIVQQLREFVPFWEEDRLFATDLKKARNLVYKISTHYVHSLFVEQKASLYSTKTSACMET